ncbi:MAG: hypothetical protein AB7F22_12385 [Reyranella sp.]
MVELPSLMQVLGVAASLVALILAWRAYRSASEEHERRKREKDDRRR